MAATAAYTIGNNGSMTSTGAPGMVDVTGGGASSLGSLAPHPTVSSNPYSVFNSALSDMLTKATNANTQGAANLENQKSNLSAMSVAPNGAQPFNPQASSASQVGAQQANQASFQPAIGSITAQEAALGSAFQGIQGTVGQIQNALFKTLSPGQSLVSPDGSVVQQGHLWTYQLNPNMNGGKGGYDSYDSVTHTWASDPINQIPSVPELNANSPIVAGIDISGKSTGMPGPYATDPMKAHNDNILYNELVTSQPAGVPTPDGINAFISKIAVGGKSPVTGQMIMMSAKKWGIDANYLAANLGEETQFGTTGTSVLQKYNPGGLTDMNGQYSSFKNWVAGVDATAHKLAQYMPGNSAAPNGRASGGSGGGSSSNGQGGGGSSGTDPRGNVISPTYQARVAQLSPLLQKYVLAGPGQVAYLDGDSIDAASAGAPTGTVRQSALAAQQASAAGIPLGDSTTKAQMANINTLAQQQQAMHQLVDGILKNGTVSWQGHIYNSISALLNAHLQTDPNLTLLDSYISSVTGAAQNIKSLAGGQGSGIRITGFEIGSVQQTFPQVGDSSQQADAKLRALDYKLSSALSTAFPDFHSGTLQNPNIVQPQSQSQVGGGNASQGSGSGGTVKVVPGIDPKIAAHIQANLDAGNSLETIRQGLAKDFGKDTGYSYLDKYMSAK